LIEAPGPETGPRMVPEANDMNAELGLLPTPRVGAGQRAASFRDPWSPRLIRPPQLSHR
jgi:hypothetical protein